MKSHQLRIKLESTIQQLNTQIRVSRQLEHERDKANDDYEFTKVSNNYYYCILLYTATVYCILYLYCMLFPTKDVLLPVQN